MQHFLVARLQLQVVLVIARIKVDVRAVFLRAQAELDAARSALRILAREVRDVEEAGAFQIAGGDFLSFADMFFDNAFLDIYVQTQISEAKRQVAGAIQQVEALRDRLSRM